MVLSLRTFQARCLRLGALATVAILLGSCGGRSLAAADDAIRSLDDVVRASDNVSDDFARAQLSSTSELRAFLQRVDDPAESMRTRVQVGVNELRSEGLSSVDEAMLEDISCAISDYYFNFGVWPDEMEIVAYVEDQFQVQSRAVADQALEIVQELANDSLSLRDFAASVSAACIGD